SLSLKLWSRRSISSRRFVGTLNDCVKFPLGLVGAGKRKLGAARINALGSIRFAGMIFPGNGWPVVGSLICVLIALKSPVRSARLGVGTLNSEDCRNFRHSSLKKKNVRDLL